MGIWDEGKLVQERRSRYCRSSRVMQTLVGTNVSPTKNFQIKHEYALDTHYYFVRAFAEQKPESATQVMGRPWGEIAAESVSLRPYLV